MSGTLSVPEYRVIARLTPHFKSIGFKLGKHSTLVLETLAVSVELLGFYETFTLVGLDVSFTGGSV